MAINRFTLSANCRSLGNEDIFRDYILNGTSEYIYLIDPNDTLVSLALSKQKKVIVRVSDPFGDKEKDSQFASNYYKLRTPFETLAYIKSKFKKWSGNSNIYYLIGYDKPNGGEIIHHLNWFQDYVKMAVDSSINLVIGTWNTSDVINVDSSGITHEITGGKWDNLLELINKNRERVIIEVHESMMGRLWGNQISGFPNAIISRTQMKQQPKSLSWNSYNINGQFYIGRIAPLVYHSRAKGLRVRFALGGDLWNRIGGISSIADQVDSKFGMTKYGKKICGIRSHYMYYKYMSGKAIYSYDDFCEDIYEDMKWVDQEYPEEFQYITISRYSNHIDDYSHDISSPEVKCLITYTKNYLKNHQLITPMDNMKDAIVRNTGKYRRRIRKSTGTNAQTIDFLETNKDLHTKIGEATIRDNGYVWLPILTKHGTLGYVAISSLRKPTDKYINWQTKKDPESQWEKGDTAPIPDLSSITRKPLVEEDLNLDINDTAEVPAVIEKRMVEVSFLNYTTLVEYDEMPKISEWCELQAMNPYAPLTMKGHLEAMGKYIKALHDGANGSIDTYKPLLES